MMIRLFSLLACCCTLAAAGDKPPGISLPTLRGDTVRLSSFAGKVVVLDFWVMWCETCLEEIPKICRLNADYAPRGVIFLGIHLGEKDTAKIAEFVRNAGIKYPVLNDPDEMNAAAYKFESPPLLTIIDSTGNVVRRYREIDKKANREIRRILDSLVGKQ